MRPFSLLVSAIFWLLSMFQVNLSSSPSTNSIHLCSYLVYPVNQLGMNFKETRHATTIRHVETFNSTKKRAGVVFEVRFGFFSFILRTYYR